MLVVITSHGGGASGGVMAFCPSGLGSNPRGAPFFPPWL